MERFAHPDIPLQGGPAETLQTSPTNLWVISPCFNRPADVQNLCQALRKLQIPGDLSPTLILVDNASDPPIIESLSSDVLPEPWTFIDHRQSTNSGGSGGFNAGMRCALGIARNRDLIWLLDSDAVPQSDALEHLMAGLGLPETSMVGSTLIDPETGEPFECGGHIDPLSGEYLQSPPEGDEPIVCDYLAACSILTTAAVVRQAGLFPETFLNGDDVGWGCRVRLATRGRLLGIPASRVAHPGPGRMRTVPRYFAARGAMVALTEGGLPVIGRATKETMRATALHAAGLHAVGDLHIAGLRDATRGRVTGALPKGLDTGNPDRPGLTEEQARAETKPPARVFDARVRKGNLAHLFNPVGSIAHEIQGGWTISTTPATQARRAIGAALQGMQLALKMQRAGGVFGHAPPAPPSREVRGDEQGLSIVIVAYNRKDALLRTLAHLADAEPTASAQTIVVDNASTDGTGAAVRREFPRIKLIRQETNTGVAAFTRGVAAATGKTVLILADDSWPDADALALALLLLDDRPDVAAVALPPRHPDGGRSEWPFARRVYQACETWPVMGCGNLVRKEAWHRVGGYCEPYFLYRNDTDLALALHTQGRVWFDPSWVVWHDSPAATNKSPRWCHLATRNWLWMSRRHGQGSSRALAWLGVAQAFRLAGLRPAAVLAVVRGVVEGVTKPPPRTSSSSPEGWKALMRLRLGKPVPAVPRYVASCPPLQKALSTQAPLAPSRPTSFAASPTTPST